MTAALCAHTQTTWGGSLKLCPTPLTQQNSIGMQCGCRAGDYGPPEVYVAVVVIKMMRRPLACAVTSTTSAHIGLDADLRRILRVETGAHELVNPTRGDAATKNA